MEFDHDTCWVLKIFPRTLWCLFESTVWIGCPAVASLVPEVVGVSVGMMLVDVVACAVKSGVALKSLRNSSSCQVLVGKVGNNNAGEDHLSIKLVSIGGSSSYKNDGQWLSPVLFCDKSVPVPT